jgi:orotidine-5'-phosphate decarboxylase
MGSDSVTPFLQHENKWVILLALTSNAGALDFQTQVIEDGSTVFEKVLKTSQDWGTPENLMYVVGATRAELIGEVRRLAPDHFFLVPGVGAQGGSLEDVAHHGMNDDCGLLVNSSRGIIYASQGEDFAEAARAAALKVQQQMQQLLQVRAILA